MKLVPLELAPDFDLQTLARLVRVSEHPGLVTLLDHGREGPWWYQIAEWVATYDELLDKRVRARCEGDGLKFLDIEHSQVRPVVRKNSIQNCCRTLWFDARMAAGFICCPS